LQHSLNTGRIFSKIVPVRCTHYVYDVILLACDRISSKIFNDKWHIYAFEYLYDWKCNFFW